MREGLKTGWTDGEIKKHRSIDRLYSSIDRLNLSKHGLKKSIGAFSGARTSALFELTPVGTMRRFNSSIDRLNLSKHNGYFSQSDRLNRWSLTSLTDAYEEKMLTASNGSFELRGLYIYLTPAIWSLLETRDTPYKNISKPSKCKLIKHLGLAQALWVLVLGLALERVWEQGVVPCGWFWSESNRVSRCTGLFGVLVARRHVNDPPTWCGAASTTLYGGRGDPLPLWASSLMENGIKVTVIVFTEETWLPKAILFVSASTTGT